MTDIDPGLLGTLTDVSGASFVARLHMVGERFDGYRQVGVERVAIGQVGAYTIARGQNEQVLCQIVSACTEVRGQETVRLVRMLPLGEVTADGQFFRGVGRFPPLDTPV